MARRHHTHDVSASDGVGDLAPPVVDTHTYTRQEFGRRLYSLMLQKGWTQAELARQSGILADSVSNYVRGNIMPSPKNLLALAKVFGMRPGELLPNYTESAIEADKEPPIDLKVSSADPTKAWLRISRVVKFDTAARIIQMIREDDAVDGK